MKKLIILLICILLPANVYALTPKQCFDYNGLIYAARQCATANGMVPVNSKAEIEFANFAFNACNKGINWEAGIISHIVTEELKETYSCAEIFDMNTRLAEQYGFFIEGYKKDDKIIKP